VNRLSLGVQSFNDESLRSLGRIHDGKQAANACEIAKKSGFDNFIRFIAILSIMLGVMNLLPIPVLDGGHLLYYVIEIVKGSPVSDKIQLIGYKVGMFMLVGLMLFATYNDVTRPL